MWQQPNYTMWPVPMTQPAPVMIPSSIAANNQVGQSRTSSRISSTFRLLPHMKILPEKADKDGTVYKPVIDPENGILYMCSSCDDDRLFKRLVDLRAHIRRKCTKNKQEDLLQELQKTQPLVFAKLLDLYDIRKNTDQERFAALSKVVSKVTLESLIKNKSLNEPVQAQRKRPWLDDLTEPIAIEDFDISCRSKDNDTSSGMTTSTSDRSFEQEFSDQITTSPCRRTSCKKMPPDFSQTEVSRLNQKKACCCNCYDNNHRRLYNYQKQCSLPASNNSTQLELQNELSYQLPYHEFYNDNKAKLCSAELAETQCCENSFKTNRMYHQFDVISEHIANELNDKINQRLKEIEKSFYNQYKQSADSYRISDILYVISTMANSVSKFTTTLTNQTVLADTEPVDHNQINKMKDNYAKATCFNNAKFYKSLAEIMIEALDYFSDENNFTTTEIKQNKVVLCRMAKFMNQRVQKIKLPRSLKGKLIAVEETEE